jgi:hypothetical protein
MMHNAKASKEVEKPLGGFISAPSGNLLSYLTPECWNYVVRLLAPIKKPNHPFTSATQLSLNPILFSLPLSSYRSVSRLSTGQKLLRDSTG